MENLKDILNEIKTKQDIISFKLEEHFNLDEKNLEKINNELNKIYSQLDEYNSELKIHILGTIQNRDSIKELKEINKIFQEELKELQKIALTLKITWKTVTSVAIIVSTITGFIIKIFF